MNTPLQQAKSWLDVVLPELQQCGGRVLEGMADGRPGEKVFSVVAISTAAPFAGFALLAFPGGDSAMDAFTLAKPLHYLGHSVAIGYCREPRLEKEKTAQQSACRDWPRAGSTANPLSQ
jgi:hypothetical protein